MSKRASCRHCLRPLSHCLCADIPCLPSRTEIRVLQHPDEHKHALNTARLLCLGLARAELLTAERLPDDWLAWLQDADYRVELLFPGPAADVLQQSPDPRPRRLLLLDGTWRKARKLYYLNPLLQSLPQVTLPLGQCSRYLLRKAPATESLSTLEAGVAALRILEPDTDFSPLLRPFERLLAGQVAAMGEQVYQAHFAGRAKPDTGTP